MYSRNFVEEKLGVTYTEGRKSEFAKSFKESGPASPVFFILSPGVDPLKDVESLGKRSTTMHMFWSHRAKERCFHKCKKKHCKVEKNRNNVFYLFVWLWKCEFQFLHRFYKKNNNNKAVLCALGKKLGFTIDLGKLHNVSLGQGQETVAEIAMEKAAKEGHWVILQVWIFFFVKLLPFRTKTVETMLFF